jgi:uncharacterized tellurite resistance protein B-like protein
MLEAIKRMFRAPMPADDTARPDRTHALRVATCALFVEMARIDEAFTEKEMARIISVLQERYGLESQEADALIAEADRELDDSLDLWQFARIINENCSNDEKIEIVETLWQIVFVDGRMDDHEHYLMNKLKNLLRLEHRQLIDAKLKVTRA